jgi:uncharacterized membrane protein
MNDDVTSAASGDQPGKLKTVPPVPAELLPPELQRLDPKTRQTAEQFYLQVAFHSGPLPPPEQLEQYEKAIPGAGTTILEMAKNQQATRHYCQRAEVDAIKRGQLCAIGAFALAMGAVGALAYFHATAAAGTVGTTAITVFGGAFILARHLGAKQDEQKRTPSAAPQPKKKGKR